MSETYTFNEPGTIPGIPGTFAGVRVDVDDAGNFTVTPLAAHLAFEASDGEPVAEEAAPVVPELPSEPVAESTPEPEPLSTADEVVSTPESV